MKFFPKNFFVSTYFQQSRIQQIWSIFDKEMSEVIQKDSY